MPPADDPLARLHGRAAFAKALADYFRRTQSPSNVETWPVLGGWELGKSKPMARLADRSASSFAQLK
jgi:hypothetical protein